MILLLCLTLALTQHRPFMFNQFSQNMSNRFKYARNRPEAFDTVNIDKTLEEFAPDEFIRFEILRAESEQIIEDVDSSVKSVKGMYFCNNPRLGVSLVIMHQNGTMVHNSSSTPGSSFLLESLTPGKLMMNFTNDFSMGRVVLSLAMHINKAANDTVIVDSGNSILSSTSRRMMATIRKLSGFEESENLYNSLIYRQKNST